MDSTQILEDALQLLKTKGWTKGVLARTKSGASVDPEDDNATCFCAVGAIYRACSDSSVCVSSDASSEALTLLQNSAKGCRSLGEHNDELETPEQLHAWFERAIELSREAGQ